MSDTPYRVTCPVHDVQGLTQQEYDRQISGPGDFWRCPVCGVRAVFDVERYEQSLKMTLEQKEEYLQDTQRQEEEYFSELYAQERQDTLFPLLNPEK